MFTSTVIFPTVLKTIMLGHIILNWFDELRPILQFGLLLGTIHYFYTIFGQPLRGYLLQFNMLFALCLIGCLIYELFSGTKLGKTEELRNTASIPKVWLLNFGQFMAIYCPLREYNSTLNFSMLYFTKMVPLSHKPFRGV